MTPDQVVEYYKKAMAPRFVEGAQIIRDEIVSLIPISEEPSAPGAPPHSPGPYSDSWKYTTRARIRGDNISAAAYSAAKGGTDEDVSLPIELEFGGKNAPRPHIRPAVARVQARLRALFTGTAQP